MILGQSGRLRILLVQMRTTPKGPISPPWIHLLHHMDLDVRGGTHGARGEAAVEDQHNISSTGKRDADYLCENQQQPYNSHSIQLGEGMDYNLSWAAAQGPNAPPPP